MPLRIFGREPVYWLAFAAIVLKVAGAYWLHLTSEEQGAVMAVLSLLVAVASALVLKTGAVGAAILNLGQGVLALFLAFGVHMAAQDQVMWMGLLEAGVALVLHHQVQAPVPAVPIERKSALERGGPKPAGPQGV